MKKKDRGDAEAQRKYFAALREKHQKRGSTTKHTKMDHKEHEGKWLRRRGGKSTKF